MRKTRVDLLGFFVASFLRGSGDLRRRGVVCLTLLEGFHLRRLREQLERLFRAEGLVKLVLSLRCVRLRELGNLFLAKSRVGI